MLAWGRLDKIALGIAQSSHCFSVRDRNRIITKRKIWIFEHTHSRDELCQIIDRKLSRERVCDISLSKNSLLRAYGLLNSACLKNQRRVDSRKVLKDFSGFFRNFHHVYPY